LRDYQCQCISHELTKVITGGVRRLHLNFSKLDSLSSELWNCVSQNELLGQSLYNFVYPEDHDELTRNLTPDGMQPMSAPSPTGIAQVSELAHDNSSSSSEESSTNHRTNERTKRFREQRRNFKIRMAQRTNSRRDHTQYECFDVSGLLRLAEACKNADTNGNRGRQRGEF